MAEAETSQLAVTKACLRGQNDCIAYISRDDHQVGDMSGIARWNGHSWRWAKLTTDWIVELDFYKGNPISLDFSGRLSFYDTNDNPHVHTMPLHGCNGCCVNGERIFITGMNGLFMIYDSDDSHIIDLALTENLYASFFYNNMLYIGCQNGTICTWPDSKLLGGELLRDFDVTSFCTHNNRLYALAGKKNSSIILDVLASSIVFVDKRLYSLGSDRQLGLLGLDSAGFIWAIDLFTSSVKQVVMTFPISCIGKTDQHFVAGGLSGVIINGISGMNTVIFDLALPIS